MFIHPQYDSLFFSLIRMPVQVLGNSRNLTKTDHTFSGWNTAADGSGAGYVENDELTMPASDLALFAQWEPVTYSIIYDGNGAGSFDYLINC
jgi:uncharacterized repeat protein (TIGR02543 family)